MSFNALWTASSLHLADGLGWTDREVGMFPLVGVGAGVVVILASGVVRRLGLDLTTSLTMAATTAAVAVILIGGGSDWLFAIGLFVVTVTTQLSQSANQTRALGAHLDTPAQANTAFMAIMYIGGAAGSTAGARLYLAGGLDPVALFAVGVVLAGALSWATFSRAGPADRSKN